jgi:hypothetical protein
MEPKPMLERDRFELGSLVTDVVVAATGLTAVVDCGAEVPKRVSRLFKYSGRALISIEILSYRLRPSHIALHGKIEGVPSPDSQHPCSTQSFKCSK